MELLDALKKAGLDDETIADVMGKARMEKELETAQIVQDNFFPVDYMTIDDYEVAAHFKPASECGGDWWGSIQIEDKLVIILEMTSCAIFFALKSLQMKIMEKLNPRHFVVIPRVTRKVYHDNVRSLFMCYRFGINGCDTYERCNQKNGQNNTCPSLK